MDNVTPLATVTFPPCRTPMRWCKVHGRALVPAGWDTVHQCRMPDTWVPFPATRLLYALQWVQWAGSRIAVVKTACDACMAARTREVA